MKQILISSIALLLVIAQGSATERQWKLWYRHPAQEWEQALPVGNGRIGAMVFGGLEREHIQLNEETIWSGKPEPKTLSSLNPDLLKRQQALLFAGRHDEAKKLTVEDLKKEGLREETVKVPGTTMARHIYTPLGDLWLNFGSPDELEEDYQRELDLDTAVATVTYTRAGVHFHREVFCSYPDQVLVVRLTADRPGQVTFTSRLTYRTDVKADMDRYDAELGEKVSRLPSSKPTGRGNCPIPAMVLMRASAAAM